MASNMQAVDSLVANEFAVEINGKPVSGIFGVSGLILFQLDSDGKRVKPSFEIIKMVERDASNAFNRWHRDTMQNRNNDSHPTENLSIVAIDDGIETRRWTVLGAYIAGIRYSDYDTASSEMVAETYTIMYSEIEESWTYSDSQSEG